MKKFLVPAVSAAFVLFCTIQASSAQSTIASIYSGGAGTYSLVTGTVTSILNVSTGSETFTLQDNTGSALAYAIPKTVYTPTVGDNITVSAIVNAPYQGAPELTKTGLGTGSITTNSTGNAVAPIDLTVPQFVAAGTGSVSQTATPPDAEALVEIDNVTLPAGTGTLATNTSYTLTDVSGNTTTMYGYASDSLVKTAITNADSANTASSGALFGGLLTIIGYTDVYYGVPELYPLTIEAAVPEPASIGLLGVASVALLARRRRRARSV